MHDLAEVRGYFLQSINSYKEDLDIVNKLEYLSIFNTKKQLDINSFYTSVNDIIDWSIINNVSYYIKKKDTSEKINIILNMQSWAIRSWNNGVETANLNKIVISYILVERLYLLPKKDLNWNFPNEKLNTYLEKFLPTIPSIVGDVFFPEKGSYSDKKFQKDYEKSVQNNNYKGILNFLSGLEKGGGFTNDFFKVIVTVVMAVNPSLLATNIANYSPSFIALMIKYLDNNEVLVLLDEYQDKSLLPLLIGLIQIINPTGSNQLNGEILKDYDLIGKSSGIVEKIAIRSKVNNLYKFITDCSNIFMNKLWHSIFSVFITKKNQYFDHYLSEIDYSYDVGNYSFNSFSHFNIKKSNIDTVAIEIYQKYLVFLIEEKSYQRYLFCFTSYFNYIFHAIYILSGESYSKYLAKLEEISTELKRGIYSWKQNELPMLFTKWIFWLISSKKFSNKFEINDELQTTFELLENKRVLNALNCKIQDVEITFGKLIDLFIIPDPINSFVLPYGDKVIKIEWNC